MFTIKMVYKDHDRVLPAAEYKQRGTYLEMYAPRLDAAYVLSGQVLAQIDMDDPDLIDVFVINCMGKTVDRLSARPPRPEV